MKYSEKFPYLYFKYRGLKRQIKIIEYRHYSIKDKMKLDAQMYKERTGLDLDWNNLRTYTEKLQWEKLFHNDPCKVVLADKFAVRHWVSEKIGEKYLVPLLGVWDDAFKIDFNILPSQFVLKTNCGSGDVIIVKDKSLLSKKDITQIKSKLNYYLNFNFSVSSFEEHYAKITPKIICEAFLKSKDDDIPDYKFLCFNGKPYFCWVDVGRFHDHKRNVYDMNWVLQEWNQKDYGNSQEKIEKPKNFDKMISIVNELCSDFAQVRVDLYNLDGAIYFGEMTFTNGSGFELIKPYEYNLMLGEMWDIDLDKYPIA